MEIDKTINRWHEETLKWIENKIGPDILNANEIDKMCLCVAKTSSQYCAAVMQLLNKGYEFPAKALMRCLGELNAKFTWCLAGCHGQQNTIGAVEERFRSWDKMTCSKGIKLLDDFEDVIRTEEKNEHKKKLSMLEERKAKLSDVKDMPNLTELFKQLGDWFNKQFRPTFYLQFNDAVHLDLVGMTAIYGSLPQGRDELETYCVAFAYNINSLIRLRYDLDTKQIKKEYDRIMQN